VHTVRRPGVEELDRSQCGPSVLGKSPQLVACPCRGDEADDDGENAGDLVEPQGLGNTHGVDDDHPHGNRPLTEADFGKCDRALDVAIDAIRTLVDRRSDLLAEGDGGSRSTAVLLAD
jgi:hypothetical protein